MLLALFVGIVVGFVLAIPPGPVAVTAMRLGLDKSVRHGMYGAFGTALMDFFYCLLAIFATSTILKLVSNMFDSHPLIMLGFQLLVIISVIVFGVVQFKIKHKVAEPIDIDAQKKVHFLQNLSHKGPFLLGIAVAMANVANPTFLPSLTYVTMNVHALGLIENNVFSNIAFSLGFGFGNFLWLYLLIRVLVHYKDRMSAQFFERIHQFAGFTLIGFGTLLGLRVIVVTRWPEILGFIFAF
ncbi:MAG: LysE family transporter [Bacteroidota bacterium]